MQASTELPRIDGRCSWCGELLGKLPDRAQGGGNARLWCSSAHRQAAYRWRRDSAKYPGPPSIDGDRR